MRLHIRHVTNYHYDDPVAYSIQQLRLTPRTDANQHILKWQLITPGHPRSQTDAHGNTVHTLVLSQPHQEISLVVEGEVETSDDITLLPRGSGLSPLAYVAASPLTASDEKIDALAHEHLRTNGKPPGRDAFMRLMEGVRENIAYQPGITDVTHTAAEALSLGQGVCQDQAHVFIACCRACSIPARYVSGYLLTDDDQAASHAWAEAWLEDEGVWISCDVTHGRFADGRFCRLAVGRDYLDASPVRGMRNGGNGEKMQVNVAVTDSHEAIFAAQQ